MEGLKTKECLRCQTVFEITGRNTKYCIECRRIRAREATKEWAIKKGILNGKGSGSSTGKGRDNPNYKNGIGIFHKIKHEIKAIKRYCEKCSKDLLGASKYQWCMHHKDHDRTNNDASNLELLCKRCHQIEHECWKAFEGVETKVERDTLTGRYKRIEAPSPALAGDDIVRSVQGYTAVHKRTKVVQRATLNTNDNLWGNVFS